MATMIPDLDPRMIENDGERRVYAALRNLPPEYTVLYSYTFRTMPDAATDEDADFGEADFVVVCPSAGYLVLEVKQGKVGFANGQWYEEKQSGQQTMSKDPIAQAKRAMFAILNRYKEKAGANYFPLRIKYGLWFPECSHVWGELPADLAQDNVLLEPDLDSPEDAILRAFGNREKREQREAIDILINRVLAPKFRTFARLDEEIQRRKELAQQVLTEEQERILEETELDKRKVFFGAAGTGKTFLAIEKARRLAKSGRRVFLTCFNKNLAAYMRRQVPSEVTCQNFHDFLSEHLSAVGRGVTRPEDIAEHSRFYDETLPTHGFMYFADAPHEEKFDSVIIDEGQDFHENWYQCLLAMLRDQVGGEFYVFADPNQDIFGVKMGALRKLPMSKHRLTLNLRNTETISNWIGGFVKEGNLRPALKGGVPVVRKSWDTYEEEKKLIETEVGRLVSQGIRPSNIVILSPNRQDKSSLKGCEKIKEWPLREFSGVGDSGDSGDSAGSARSSFSREARRAGSAIRFSTIRSFKGLEADVVFLIGLKEGKRTCTGADVYVGGSRARFLLYVFSNKAEPPKGISG